MKESMWGYLIIALGIVIVGVLFLVQRLTTTNEQDYFLSREILESSMYDAVDWGTYLRSGKLVMSKEKFVAIFTRRFAESVNADRTYTLNFYDIYEYPPKATIMIMTKTGEQSINSMNDEDSAVDLNVNTFITGILETDEVTDEVVMTYSTSFGDVNKDGKLNETDLNIIAEGIKKNNLTAEQKKIADVNDDKKVDYNDLRILQRVVYSITPLDVDLNNVVDCEDVKLVKKAINKPPKATLTDKQKIAADANNDGNIDASDITIMETALGTTCK